MHTWPLKLTIGAKYGPAMGIHDPILALYYKEACIEHTMACGHSRQEAITIENSNLGYYSGYYSDETRRRVQALYNTAHPIFGRI